jgi:hypothetical protein
LKKTNNEFNSDVQCICKGTGKSSLIQCSWCQMLRTVLGSSLHVGQTQNPIVSFSDKFTQVTCNHIWHHEHCMLSLYPPIIRILRYMYVKKHICRPVHQQKIVMYRNPKARFW